MPGSAYVMLLQARASTRQASRGKCSGFRLVFRQSGINVALKISKATADPSLCSWMTELWVEEMVPDGSRRCTVGYWEVLATSSKLALRGVLLGFLSEAEA